MPKKTLGYDVKRKKRKKWTQTTALKENEQFEVV